MFSECSQREIDILNRQADFNGMKKIKRRPDNNGFWEFNDSNGDHSTFLSANPEIFIDDVQVVMENRGWRSDQPCTAANWRQCRWTSPHYNFVLQIVDPVAVVIGDATRYGFSTGLSVITKNNYDYTSELTVLQQVGMRIVPYEIEKACPSFDATVNAILAKQQSHVVLCVLLYGFYHYFLIDRQHIRPNIFVNLHTHARKIGNTCIFDFDNDREGYLRMCFVSRSILAQYLTIDNLTIETMATSMVSGPNIKFMKNAFVLLNPQDVFFNKDIMSEEELDHYGTKVMGTAVALAELKLHQLCDIRNSDFSDEMLGFLSFLDSSESISKRLIEYANQKNESSDTVERIKAMASLYFARLSLRVACNFHSLKKLDFSIENGELEIYLLCFKAAAEALEFQDINSKHTNIRLFAEKMNLLQN